MSRTCDISSGVFLRVQNLWSGFYSLYIVGRPDGRHSRVSGGRVIIKCGCEPRALSTPLKDSRESTLITLEIKFVRFSGTLQTGNYHR